MAINMKRTVASKPEAAKDQAESKGVFVSIDKIKFGKMILAREAALKKAKKPS